jgi:stage II sporulation protein D
MFLILISQEAFSKVKPVFIKSNSKNKNLRVKIASSIDKVEVFGEKITRNIHYTKDVKSYGDSKKIVFNCRGKSLVSRQNNKKILFASLTSPKNILKMGDNNYRGSLNIIKTPGKTGCDVVNIVPLESYLKTLLSKEMNSSWHLEALKAQAVAARTYAYHKMNLQQARSSSFFDLESSEKHQVSGSLKDITKKTSFATEQTKGMILVTNKDELTPIFFHAQCGGRTLLPEKVWKNHVEGYQEVTCKSCLSRKKTKWNTKLSLFKFKQFLRWVIKKSELNIANLDFNKKILIAPDNKNYDSFRVYLGEKVIIINKVLMRKYFGRVKVPSHNYIIGLNKYIEIRGKGNGHGVGMCQVGALDLARSNLNFKKILKFYYPNHKIKKLY